MAHIRGRVSTHTAAQAKHGNAAQMKKKTAEYRKGEIQEEENNETVQTASN